jgi:hypothetical protein
LLPLEALAKIFSRLFVSSKKSCSERVVSELIADRFFAKKKMFSTVREIFVSGDLRNKFFFEVLISRVLL